MVITSVGAKSGNLRKNPVMRVERDGNYVAVASKGGAAEHPEWYHNFVAHPEVDLQDGAREAHLRRPARSRATSGRTGGSTRSRPGRRTREYQKKTDREIPVFLLERA